LSGPGRETDVATIPPEVVAAAEERGRARDLPATLRELLEELDEESSLDV